MEGGRRIEELDSADMPATSLTEIRRLMDEAFGDRFSEDDWRHALGGTHFVIRGPAGTIVSHASVVARQLEISGRRLSTGYVEAVATQPAFRRKGHATAVMRAVAAFVQVRFELGALSSGVPGFYEKLGWIRWRGATWCRQGDRLTRTADEDGGVLVLPTRSSPEMTYEEDIAVEWRTGDVW